MINWSMESMYSSVYESCECFLPLHWAIGYFIPYTLKLVSSDSEISTTIRKKIRIRLEKDGTVSNNTKKLIKSLQFCQNFEIFSEKSQQLEKSVI